MKLMIVVKSGNAEPVITKLQTPTKASVAHVRMLPTPTPAKRS